MKKDKVSLVSSSSLSYSQWIISSCLLVSFRHTGVAFQKGDAECQTRCGSDPSSPLPNWVTLGKAINQRLTLHIKSGLKTGDIYIEV